MSDKQVTYDAPNKFARPASLDEADDALTFHGYQEFVLGQDQLAILDVDHSLQRKAELLAPFFKPRFLQGRSFLDFGANSGFFCFLAMRNGAKHATAVDMDEEYLRMVRRAKEKFCYDNLDVVQSNVENWQGQCDVVSALALIHWVYSCTATYGDLGSVIREFARLAKHMLIIEWVDPDDSAIHFFHHLDWNQGVRRGPYTLDAFEQALSDNFSRFECIGSVCPTRKIYVAWHSKHEIDLSGPMPILHGEETIISRRYLTHHEGRDYWSCVYDCGDVVVKQATRDLAEREASFLRQLNHGRFPKVLELTSDAEYAVLKLEKVHGTSIESARTHLTATRESLGNFIGDCLDILETLGEQGIEHRDIRPNNMLVREDKPVLLDFGWAISEDRNIFTPDLLNCEQRPADGAHCDVYSMGKLFDSVNQHKFPEVDLVIALMTDEHPQARVTDLSILKKLFRSITHDASSDATRQLIVTLLSLDQRHRTLQKNADAQIGTQNDAIAALTAELETVRNQLATTTGSRAWKLVLRLRRIRVAIIPPNSWRARILRRLCGRF